MAKRIVLACLALLCCGVGYLYAKNSITDVRVGPTAAIGVACSADAQTVYVAHGNGFFKNTDGGETWKQIPVK